MRPRQGRRRAGGVQGAATRTKKFVAARRSSPGEVVEGFIGIDGGSTSTKAVLLDKDRKRRSCKTYQLSKGNPIEDTHRGASASCEQQIDDQGATLEDARRRHHRLRQGHPEGRARRRCRAGRDRRAHRSRRCTSTTTSDVICDVGGQDIKIIILKNGRVKDFKLNTQCSAGNGYFLQSTAQGFGVTVEEYADIAFGAKGYARVRLRLRGVHAVATSSTSSARAGSRKRSWPACATCCPRTSGCTFRRFRTSPRSARASCCRAARSTTWPR